jgi:molybdenum cofactor cytidylyltransferase
VNPNTYVKVIGILLAAGRGERFGGAKPLARIADGRSMLEAAATNLRTAVDDLVIVIRDEIKLIQHANVVATKLNCRVVVNDAANSGMASSIICGVRATTDDNACLIALADMPYIGAETFSKLVNALRNCAADGIVQPQYQGTLGHPVGFASRYRTALLDLQGDRGARSVIETNSEVVRTIDVDDRGILVDVDTRDQLAISPK